jgi:hypothetical protein
MTMISAEGSSSGSAPTRTSADDRLDRLAAPLATADRGDFLGNGAFPRAGPEARAWLDSIRFPEGAARRAARCHGSRESRADPANCDGVASATCRRIEDEVRDFRVQARVECRAGRQASGCVPVCRHAPYRL